MLQRIVFRVLWVILGALGYCLLAFGVASRLAQTLGLPLIGLLLLATARFPTCQGWVRYSRLLNTLFISLPFVILGEVYAVVRIAQRQSDPYGVEPDLAVRRSVRALVERESWDAVVELGETTGTIDDPQVLLDMGYAHRKLGNSSKARTVYQEAIRLDPANPAPRYELARLYEETGNRQMAADEYARILETNELLPDVHFAYGALLAKLEDRPRAAKHLQKAMTLYSDDNPLRKRAASALTALRTEGRP